MLRFFLMFFVFFCGHLVFTQNYQVVWSPDYPIESTLSNGLRLVGLTENAYHLLNRPQKNNTLLSYDLNHRLVSQQNINFQFERRDLVLNGFVETKAGRFGYFVDLDDRDMTNLLVSPFEQQQFGELRKVFSQAYSGSWNRRYTTATQKIIDGDINNNFAVSKDGSKVALANVTSTERKKKDQESYNLVVFDENFVPLWEKTQIFPYQHGEIEIVQSVVSDDGTVYLLAKVIGSRKEKMAAYRAGLPGYTYKVFQIVEDDSQAFDVELPDGLAPYYAGLYLLPNSNTSEVIIGGMYTTLEKNTRLKGVFLHRISAEGSTIRSDIHPFDEEFLKGMFWHDDIDINRGLSTTFQIKNFLQFDDGSVSFIAEEYYVSYSSTGNGSGAGYSTIFHSNKLLIPRFSASGELLHIQKIDKSFSSDDSRNVSYTLGLANGKIFLLYNDHKTLSERRKLREEGGEGGRYADLTVIDENGEIIFQKTLFSNREIGMAFLPRRSKFSDTHLLIMAMNSKRYKCGLISLEE